MDQSRTQRGDLGGGAGRGAREGDSAALHLPSVSVGHLRGRGAEGGPQNLRRGDTQRRIRTTDTGTVRGAESTEMKFTSAKKMHQTTFSVVIYTIKRNNIGT